MLVSDTQRYIRSHIGVCAAWARGIGNAVQAQQHAREHTGEQQAILAMMLVSWVDNTAQRLFAIYLGNGAGELG